MFPAVLDSHIKPSTQCSDTLAETHELWVKVLCPRAGGSPLLTAEQTNMLFPQAAEFIQRAYSSIDFIVMPWRRIPSSTRACKSS